MGRKKFKEYAYPRKFIEANIKREIISKFENGMGYSAIARELGLAKSSVFYIIKNYRVKNCNEVSTYNIPLAMKKDSVIDKMEKQLFKWLKEKDKNTKYITESAIFQKAEMLHSCILEKTPGSSRTKYCNFKACKVWYKHFKKHSAVYDLLYQAENAGKEMVDENKTMKDLNTSVDCVPELMPTNADEAASIAESNLSNMMQHLPSTLLNQNCLDDKCDTPIDPLTTDTKISGPQLVKKSHCSTILEQLMSDDTYTDVTLTAQGQCLHAHKVVLCLSSSYFREVLGSSFSSSIVAFRDVTFKELKNVINFIYAGEIEIDASELESFMKTAEMLQIAAFCENQKSSSIDSSNVKSKGRNSTKTSNKRMRENSDVVNAKKKFYEDSIASENEIFSIPFIKTEIVTEDVPMEGEEFYEEQENISGTSDSSKNIYGTTFKPTARRTGQPISNCSLKKEKNTQKLNQSLQKDSATEDLQCSTNLLDNLNYQIDQDNPIDQDQFAGKQVVTQTEPTEGNPVLPPGRCPYCSESSDPVSGASLQDHLLTSHSHKPAFICQSCQRVFTVYKQYEEHVRGCGKKI